MSSTADRSSTDLATEEEKRLVREHGLCIVAPVDLLGEPIDPLYSHGIKSHTMHDNSPEYLSDSKEAKEEGLRETPIYVRALATLQIFLSAVRLHDILFLG
jgi:hypothetical protein